MLASLSVLLTSLAALAAASPTPAAAAAAVAVNEPRSDVVADLSSLVNFTTTARNALAAEIKTLLGEDETDPSVTTANEFTLYGCRKVILFVAKGSTEPGNLGDSIGPQTADGLRAQYGAANVAVEGVDYPGYLLTNLLPGGADYGGIAEAIALFKKAAAQCPNSIIVAAGYSQGAALMHRAIQPLSTAVKAKITAVVTFGDTQKLQDGAQIPNFPKDKLLIICNDGDLVCDGTLIITKAHLDYTRRVPEAVAFLVGKIGA